MLIGAVLLAAGAGSRYRGATHKLTADLSGRPVYQWALHHVMEAGFEHVIVVTGAAELELPPSVTRCHNPLWADGQASSLVAALRIADQLTLSHVVVGLADQPAIPATTWLRVAAADDNPTCPIVIATYDGRPGPNPVRLRRDVWPLLDTVGDEGARRLMRSHPEWVAEVACVGSPDDIDTLEDLQRWTSSSTSSPSTDRSTKPGSSSPI